MFETGKEKEKKKKHIYIYIYRTFSFFSCTRTRWWLLLATSRFPVTCTAVTIFPLKIIFPLERGGAEVTVITQCWWKLCEAFNHAALVPHEDTAGRLMHRTNVFMITKGEQTSSDKKLKAKLLPSCFLETQRSESHLQTFSWPNHQLVGLANPQNLPPSKTVLCR